MAAIIDGQVLWVGAPAHALRALKDSVSVDTAIDNNQLVSKFVEGSEIKKGTTEKEMKTIFYNALTILKVEMPLVLGINLTKKQRLGEGKNKRGGLPAQHYLQPSHSKEVLPDEAQSSIEDILNRITFEPVTFHQLTNRGRHHKKEWRRENL